MCMEIKIRPDENMKDGVVLCNLRTASVILLMCGIEREDLTIKTYEEGEEHGSDQQ